MIETIAINPTENKMQRPQSPNKLDGKPSPFPRHSSDDPAVLAQLYGIQLDEE